MIEKRFCAQISQERQDPFVGLAVNAEVWLMIEYNGSWGRSAVLNNDLPVSVAEWLASIYRGHSAERAMVLFIRQHMRPLQTFRCFVGVTREDRQALYKFEFDRYEDLLSLDLEAIKAGSPLYAAHLHHEPMFLVCTNGKHDMCCAKFGIPVQKEVARLVGEQAWHCSHVGGDKYAANMVCMPQGVYYSRVTVPEVSTILAAEASKEIYIEKFRGRTCYSYSVQAADYYLRQHTGVYELDAFRLLDVQQESETCWRVRFRSTKNETRYDLTIQYECITMGCDGPCRCEGAAKNIRHQFQLQALAEQKPMLA